MPNTARWMLHVPLGCYRRSAVLVWTAGLECLAHSHKSLQRGELSGFDTRLVATELAAEHLGNKPFGERAPDGLAGPTRPSLREPFRATYVSSPCIAEQGM
jgi:hypothetical protein